MPKQQKGDYYIYGLHLEGSDEIRYVGSTKLNPHRERLWGHLHEQKYRDDPKNRWIRDNRENVRAVVLAVVQEDHKLAERETIEVLLKNGHRLLNRNMPRRLTKQERTFRMVKWFADHEP